MEKQFVICLAELPRIRRQLKLSKVVLEKLNEVQLKLYSTTSSFENETNNDGVDTKIRSDKQKRTEEENKELENTRVLSNSEKSSTSNFKFKNHSNIIDNNIQSNKTLSDGAEAKIISDKQKRTEKENLELESTRVLSEPEKSLNSNLKSGNCSNAITGNIQSDVSKDRDKKRLKMKGTGASTDQENRSDQKTDYSKRELKPGNSPIPLKSANIFNAIASQIENTEETAIENQKARLNSHILISNPKTISGSHRQDLPSGFDRKDSTSIVKYINSSNSITRTIHSDKDKLKEKKQIRSESFCFLDIEHSSDHQNKTTKAVMKGTLLDKRAPNSVKSKICSHEKKQKELKQLSLGSTKYSPDKESSSEHCGRELERVVKDLIFSSESRDFLNKTDEKARNEKYKGIKMKKVRSESIRSSLDREINCDFRKRRLEGKLKDPIFHCESGSALNKTDDKTDKAKSDNSEENDKKRIRLESRSIPFVPENRSNSLKGEPRNNLTNPTSDCPVEYISNGSESKKKKNKRKSWSVVNVKSSSGKEVLKIVPSMRKHTAYNKSSCIRDEDQKYPLSPMQSLSSNSNQNLDILKTGSKLPSPYNDYSSEKTICDDYLSTGDVQSQGCRSLGNLSAERSECKSENEAALSEFEISRNAESVNLPVKIKSLTSESNLIPHEPLTRGLYSPISDASSPQPSSTSLADTTLMEQLFLKRSKLLEVIAQLKEDRSKIEETIQSTFESLEIAKASKERISKETNDMLVAKQSNKLLEAEFKEVKRKAEEIQTEMESLSDVDLIKRNSCFTRLQELQGLYTRLQKIKTEIENHRTSVLLSESVAVQEVLIAEQMKVQNIQEKCSHLEGQRDEIKLRQENLEKQLEKNKMEMDKALLKQKEFCSLLEKDISVVYTTEVTSPCKTRLESMFKNEEPPSPDSQTTFTEQCLYTLSTSSSEAMCSAVQMENYVSQGSLTSAHSTIERECQNVNKTYSTHRVESSRNQLPQSSPDSRMSPSNLISELTNLCSSVGLVKNEVISCPYGNPDNREDPMKSKTVLKLKDVKKEIIFPRETKLAFKRLVSLVLRAKPEKAENIVLQKDFVVSLINMDAWPELYSQVQRTNFLLQAIPYSVFIEDLDKIQALNNPLPDTSTSVTPEAPSENRDHIALPNPELVFSNSTPSLPEQASSSLLYYGSNNLSGLNLSEMEHEYYRKCHQTHYIQQQNRQGFYQPNYPNDNLMFHQDSFASQYWQQNMYPSQLLNSSINLSSCIPTRSYAQAENPTLDIWLDQEIPHFPTRNQTQARNQDMNKKMTTFSKPNNYNLLRMRQSHITQQTACNWHQNAFSNNSRPQYVQNHTRVQPSVLVPGPHMQNRKTDVIQQGSMGVCVVCGRQAVRYCSNCHLVAHLYCSEACQHRHWGVHQRYCRLMV